MRCACICAYFLCNSSIFFFLFIFVKVFVRYMFIYNTVEARCIPNMRAPHIVFSGGMHMIDRC